MVEKHGDQDVAPGRQTSVAADESLAPPTRFSLADTDRQAMTARQDLANPALDPAVRGLVDQVDAARNQQNMPGHDSFAAATRRAGELVRTRGDALWRDLLDNVLDTSSNPDVVLAVKELIERRGMDAFASGDGEQIAAVGKAIWNYRQRGSEMARAFAARRDMAMTPEQRIQAMVHEAILAPSAALARELERAKDEAAKRNVLAKMDLKRQKMVEALRRLGYDPYNLPADLVRDRDAAAEIVRTVSAEKATVGDKMYEYWINAILSSPVTHAVNITGNAATLAIEYTAQRFTEALIADSARLFGAKLEGAATVAEMGYVYRQMFGPGMALAGRNMVAAFRTEQPQLAGQKLEETKGAIAGAKGRVIRLPGRALIAADEAFKGVVYQAEMAALAYRQALAEGHKGDAAVTRADQIMAAPSAELRHQAFQQALKMTFQETPFQLARAFSRLRNEAFSLKLLFPFVKTPANLLRSGFRRTPLGTLAMVRKGLRGDYENAPQAMIHDLAEQVLGWALAGLVVALVGGGDDDDHPPIITGSMVPANRSGERSARYAHLPPMSIRIGDRWFSYARLDPMATTLGAMVDAATNIRDMRLGAPVDMALSRLWEATKGQVRDKTFLQGLGDIVRAIESSGTGTPAETYLENFASSWMPNAMRSAMAATDPHLRRRQRADGIVDLPATIAQNIMGKAVPLQGMPWELPVRVDYWGNPIEKPGEFGPATDILWRMFVPIRTQKVKDDRMVDRLLLNWQRQKEREGVPEDGWFPSIPSPYFTHEGERVDLTPDEYQTWLKLAGDHVLRMVERREWNPDRPTAREVDRLRDYFRAGRARGKAHILRERRRAARQEPVLTNY